VNPNPKYILDADVFIESKKHWYAFDIAPAFWENLIQWIPRDQIQSIDRIRDQLAAGNDELANWVTDSNLDSAFERSDQDDVIAAFTEIVVWVQAQAQFTPAAKAQFANDPDGWLIAFARARDRVLVTHEVFNPEIKRKVPIPNVCQHFGIRYIDTFQMLRELGIKWNS
jgi:hypothetical protein